MLNVRQIIEELEAIAAIFGDDAEIEAQTEDGVLGVVPEGFEDDLAGVALLRVSTASARRHIFSDRSRQRAR